MTWINTTQTELQNILTELKEVDNPSLAQRKDIATIELFIANTENNDYGNLSQIGFSLRLDSLENPLALANCIHSFTGLWSLN